MAIAEFISGDRAFWRHPFFFVFISMGFWDACLFLPSLEIAHQSVPNTGGSYLMIGWIGPVGGNFEWYANPALVLSAYFLLKRWWPASMASAIIALALISILFFTRSMLADEGGARSVVTAFLIGYWLWVASAITLLIGAIVQMLQPRTVT